MAEKEKIQEVPEGWETLPLIDCFDYFLDGDWIETEHIKKEGIRIIQTGNIGAGKYIDNTDRRKFIDIHSFKHLNCKKVFPGDILICRLADPIGRACIAPYYNEYYVTAVDVVICRPNENYNNKFLVYFINRDVFLKRIGENASGSTRQRIARKRLEQIELTIPQSLPEQRTIASVLSTCDDAIEKTDAKIKKLKCIKQGLMQDLFRYGIDENGKMRSEATHRFKDSPLGRIPEEWEVVELNKLCKVTSSKRIYFDEYTDEGIPFFRSKEIIQKVNGEPLTDVLYIPSKKFETIKNRFGIPKQNEILITSVGTLGIPYLVKQGDMFYFKDGNLIWLKDFNNELVLNFLIFFLPQLIGKQIDNLTIGTSQKAFTIEKIKRMKIIKPKEPEQSCIASILSSADEAIEKEEAYKQKLLAIKHGLMEDLLSGKVRVNKLIREAA